MLVTICGHYNLTASSACWVSFQSDVGGGDGGEGGVADGGGARAGAAAQEPYR